MKRQRHTTCSSSLIRAQEQQQQRRQQPCIQESSLLQQRTIDPLPLPLALTIRPSCPLDTGSQERASERCRTHADEEESGREQMKRRAQGSSGNCQPPAERFPLLSSSSSSPSVSLFPALSVLLLLRSIEGSFSLSPSLQRLCASCDRMKTTLRREKEKEKKEGSR